MRTVVVTGSASGIGKALGELFRSRGDRVIGVDLHDADVVADLSTDDGRASLVEQVRDLSGGTVDAVVANAGLVHYRPVTVAVNHFGAVATLEGLRPLLESSPAPRASVTCSFASILPVDDELVDLCLAGDEPGALARAQALVELNGGTRIYNSAKAAVARWVRRAAPTAAWAGAGIPLNAVAPGLVETPMMADLFTTPEAREKIESLIPMPLHGHMDAGVVARAHAWLVSEENSHMCGQVVFVDGGADVVRRGDSAW